MNEASSAASEKREAAEREVRRGNLKAALEVYEELLREHPHDESLRVRLTSLRDLLQPMELTHPKSAAEPSSQSTTSAHEAEAAANRGDIPAAVKTYEALVEEDPGNELFRERLEELRELASDPVMSGAMPRSRPPSPRERPEHVPSPDPGIATPSRLGRRPGDPGVAPDRGEARTPSVGSDLPSDPIALLEKLLERIAANRRQRG